LAAAQYRITPWAIVLAPPPGQHRP
jgi:hypothetical protein